MVHFSRAILIVLDSVGIGSPPDAGQTVAGNFGVRLPHGDNFLSAIYP